MAIYVDAAGWQFEYSLACLPGGNGQCDGGDGCSCPCHTSPSLPRTVAQVARWHEIGWILAGIPRRRTSSRWVHPDLT
jgi:hypothetical protein